MRLRQEIKKNNGVAMIVCITIIAVLVIFCFSLLLVSYTFYASQNKNTQSDRNAEAAKSLSFALREEIVESSEKSNLVKYLRYNVQQKSWPFYAPGVDGHGEVEAKRYFKLSKNDKADIKGYPGKIEVCIYWMLPEDMDLDPETWEREMLSGKLDVNHTRLFVEVECKSGSQSYVTVSEYQLFVYKDHSTFPPTSTVVAVNPAGNSIDTERIWKWSFVGIE